jgi:hypothetical protein
MTRLEYFAIVLVTLAGMFTFWQATQVAGWIL